MTTKIGGFDSSPVPVSTGGTVKRGEDAAVGAQSSKAAVASDTQITESARQLAALEQTVRDLPAVDEAKVASLRDSIQNGLYQIDSGRIADKLLQLEHSLSQT